MHVANNWLATHIVYTSTSCVVQFHIYNACLITLYLGHYQDSRLKHRAKNQSSMHACTLSYLHLCS